MANRTMQAKSLKLRRQKRAWAKPLAIASGITPNRGVLGEYKERAKGLGLSEYEQDQLIRLFYKRDPIVGTPAGRAEVLALLEELKKRVPELMFFEVLDNCYQRCVLFYNSDKTCWIVSHTDKRKHITRRSIEYGTKSRALQVWYMDKVIWVSHQPIQEG